MDILNLKALLVAVLIFVPIVLLGIIVGNLTWATVAIVAIALAFQYRRLINEERVLRATFREYAAYGQTTPMLIPSISLFLVGLNTPHAVPRRRKPGRFG